MVYKEEKEPTPKDLQERIRSVERWLSEEIGRVRTKMDAKINELQFKIDFLVDVLKKKVGETEELNAITSKTPNVGVIVDWYLKKLDESE